MVLSETALSTSPGSIVTKRPFSNSYPLTISSGGTSPWIGHAFLYWILLLHPRWSWLREMSPPPVAVAVYVFTAKETRPKRTNPDQTEREAMAEDLSRPGAAADARVLADDETTIHGRERDSADRVSPRGPKATAYRRRAREWK